MGFVFMTLLSQIITSEFSRSTEVSVQLAKRMYYIASFFMPIDFVVLCQSTWATIWASREIRIVVESKCLPLFPLDIFINRRARYGRMACRRQLCHEGLHDRLFPNGTLSNDCFFSCNELSWFPAKVCVELWKPMTGWDKWSDHE